MPPFERTENAGISPPLSDIKKHLIRSLVDCGMESVDRFPKKKPKIKFYTNILILGVLKKIRKEDPVDIFGELMENLPKILLEEFVQKFLEDFLIISGKNFRRNLYWNWKKSFEQFSANTCIIFYRMILRKKSAEKSCGKFWRKS